MISWWLLNSSTSYSRNITQRLMEIQKIFFPSKYNSTLPKNKKITITLSCAWTFKSHCTLLIVKTCCDFRIHNFQPVFYYVPLDCYFLFNFFVSTTKTVISTTRKKVPLFEFLSSILFFNKQRSHTKINFSNSKF